MDRPDSYSFPELIRNKIGKYILSERSIDRQFFKPENYSKIYIKGDRVGGCIINSLFAYLFAEKEPVKLEDVCNNYISRYTRNTEMTKMETVYQTVYVSTNYTTVYFTMVNFNGDRCKLCIYNCLGKGTTWFNDEIHINLLCKEYESQLDAFMNPTNA